MRIPILFLTLLAAACAPTPKEIEQAQAREATQQEKLDKELAGLTPGKPTNCLPNFRTQQAAAYGSTILYKVSNGLVYRSETNGGCSTIGRDVLVTRTFNGQTCSGDIAFTVDRTGGFQTGSCFFGQFTPYRKP